MAGLQQRKDRPRYHFIGDATLRPKTAHKDSPQEREPYVVDDPELKQAIDLAIYLRRPLLLEGEAGCGKTQLARAIAYELGLPFYRWDIRSMSLAKEGLYEYDALLRLHDVQMSQSGASLGRDPRNAGNYLRYGALGNAFQLKDCPAIVLIDEIDKADLDFPNDLLTVLDEPWAFDVSEAEGPDGKPMRVGPAAHPPIVIITSNREKGYLPLPFLRRCIYYYMKFPDKAGLKAIVEAHYGEIETQSEAFSGEVVDVAIDKLLMLRESSNLFKNPSTSEFLDWIDALLQFGNAEQMLLWLRSPDVKQIPFRELLFKVQKDWVQFTAATVVGG
jgi:MoxR-like ATPase